MSKLQVRKIFSFNDNIQFSLAQNFAKDASKTGEKYAQEGLKQGQKLGEQAYEVGKDKGNRIVENHLIFIGIYSQ